MTDEMVTWSDPEGGLLFDEFQFVTEPEWFDDVDDPMPVRRQRWVCVEDEVGTYWPTTIQLCDACCGEGELTPPETADVVACPACNGSGEHPMRAAGFVTEDAS